MQRLEQTEQPSNRGTVVEIFALSFPGYAEYRDRQKIVSNFHSVSYLIGISFPAAAASSELGLA